MYWRTLPERALDVAVDSERSRIRREAITMTLYVSVVLLATLAALPSGHHDDGSVQGPVGVELVSIIWGSTLGLSLAHWFAFRVASQGFGSGRLRGHDLDELTFSLAGAGFVALMCSVPVVFLSEAAEQRAVLFVPTLFIGVVSYLVERANGRTRRASALFCVVALVVGLIVATVKYTLSSH